MTKTSCARDSDNAYIGGHQSYAGSATKIISRLYRIPTKYLITCSKQVVTQNEACSLFVIYPEGSRHFKRGEQVIEGRVQTMKK